MANILIYALNYWPEPVGVGKYTGEIGSYFVDQGHEVRVVTALPHYPEWKVPTDYRSSRYSYEVHEGASIFRCPIFLKRPMRGIWRLFAPASFAVTSFPIVAWQMLRHRPDVLFCVEPTLFTAPAALALSWITGARTILHVQDLEIEAAFAVGHLNNGFAKRFALACENAVVRTFGQIITVSDRMRDKIVRKGVPRDRVAVVRNWVDLEAIKPLQGRNRYRDEYGWSDSLIIALYAGSLGAKQALHVVLDAAQQMQNRPDLLFVIAGNGPDKSALVERYGRLPNVRFLPPQPEARMCDLLNLADIHILPQTRGIADLVLPSKLGGMLASGRPVLATADEGTELFEVLSGTAIIVPPGDSEAITRELTVFADQARHHPHIGDGRKLVANMSRETCLRSIEEHLPRYA